MNKQPVNVSFTWSGLDLPDILAKIIANNPERFIKVMRAKSGMIVNDSDDQINLLGKALTVVANKTIESALPSSVKGWRWLFSNVIRFVNPEPGGIYYNDLMSAAQKLKGLDDYSSLKKK